MLKRRCILVVTGSRGEYGYIRPVLQRMKGSRLVPHVLATNMHLLPEFGHSVQAFQHDQIRVDTQIHMALAGYTNATMVKSLGIFFVSISDVLHNLRPDIVLVSGDRGEQLVTAIAAAHMNVPVGHIQAGELSGNIDGISRHAIARFAHIHFAANADAERRLIRSGEQSFRVFKVGAPQLDDFADGKLWSPRRVAERFRLDLNKPTVLVLQHPVTEQMALAGAQMGATLEAVASLGHQTIVIYPNNDAGSLSIQKCIQNHRRLKMRVERNISREAFGGLLHVASVIVGNSSSGLIEAPFFRLPAVNIGRRQEGRYQGRNVVNVQTHDPEQILKGIRSAMRPSFRARLPTAQSPYGDGKSSQRIIRVLETIPIDEKLLFKQITF